MRARKHHLAKQAPCFTQQQKKDPSKVEFIREHFPWRRTGSRFVRRNSPIKQQCTTFLILRQLECLQPIGYVLFNTCNRTMLYKGTVSLEKNWLPIRQKKTLPLINNIARHSSLSGNRSALNPLGMEFLTELVIEQCFTWIWIELD